MKCIAISDTHGYHQVGEQYTLPEIPECDLLIHTGDCTNRGSIAECHGFLHWFAFQPGKQKILVPGNHDWAWDQDQQMMKQLAANLPGIKVLLHEPWEYQGIRFFGSPIQPKFCNWAFNKSFEYRERAWKQIPLDTQVLLTHCPPKNILDTSSWDHRIGCHALKRRIKDLGDLRVHVFGHNHHGYGRLVHEGVEYINASTCDEKYNPINLPMEFLL